MNFVATVCDQQGREKQLQLEAGSITEARSLAAEGGAFVVSIQEDAGKNPSARGSVPEKIKKSRARTAHFARELSVLISTGTPMTESLQAMERQTSDGPWKRVLGSVRTEVEEGGNLSDALGKFPRIFDPVFCSLVAAGESSGRLHELLGRLAAMKRREIKSRSLLIGSATYPAVLIVVSFGVLLAMTLFVIPRFAGLFETLNAPLPWTTELLLILSGLMRSYWWAVLAGIALACAGLWVSWQSMATRRYADRLLSKIPIAGPMTRGFTIARMTRLLGVLLESRVSMLESLDLVRRSLSRPLYHEWAIHAKELVTRGDSLSHSFRNEMLFTPSVQEALANAERGGRLAPVMLEIADYLDEDNESSARTLSNLLEPLIMVCLGVVVAFVALSMFIPLFDLTASAGGD